MEYEMETDQFSLPKNRTRANFDSESPTLTSGVLNLGVDDDIRYQMTSNPTTDQVSVYSQDSSVHNRVHRGGNRRYSGLDLMRSRRQRKRNKIEFDADGNEITRSQYELENLQATDRGRLLNTRELRNPYPENHHGRNSYRASSFITHGDRRRHQGAVRYPHANPFNVEVYPTNQQVSIHRPVNQPMNQQVIQHVYQPRHQQVYQPRHPPMHQQVYQQQMNPQINQWYVEQYPPNSTTQQNVWSTIQPNQMITQQPLSLTAQPEFYGQPPITVTQQNPGRADTFIVEIAISIFTTIFFFFPLGIAALCYAVKARRTSRNGRYDEAKRHGKTAARLIIAALFLGIITYVSSLAIYFFPPDNSFFE